VTKHGFSCFYGSFYVVVYFVTNACLLNVCFIFSLLSQEIGWEESLRNDLFCVGWDIKPELIQSIRSIERALKR